MAVSSDYLDFVLEQLAPVGPLTSRRMFGGVGLYAQGLFFALVDDDTLYLKGDEALRPDFEAAGSIQFAPFGMVIVRARNIKRMFRPFDENIQPVG